MTASSAIRRGLGLALAAVLIAGCGDSTGLGPHIDLASARKKWEQAAPQDYSFTLSRDCFCWLTSPMRVTVHGDSVTSIVLLVPQVLHPSRVIRAETVSALFDLIAEALIADAARVTVEYDPILGFPRSFFVDWDERVPDDEMRYRVSDVTFAPLG